MALSSFPELSPAPENMLFVVKTRGTPNAGQTLSLCREESIEQTEAFAYNATLKLIIDARRQPGTPIGGGLVSSPASYPALFDVQNATLMSRMGTVSERERAAELLNEEWANSGNQLLYVLSRKKGHASSALLAGKFRRFMAHSLGIAPVIVGPEPLWDFLPPQNLHYPAMPFALPLPPRQQLQARPGRLHAKGT